MISFVETKLFTRWVQEYLSDEEYSQLQLALAANPEVGSVIPGSGGVRKMRRSIADRGKRGGLRITCFLRTLHGQNWMLTLYPKSVAENIPAHVLKQIKDELDG